MGKSSLYRGVTLFRPTGKWRAQVTSDLLSDGTNTLYSAGCRTRRIRCDILYGAEVSFVFCVLAHSDSAANLACQNS